MLHPPKDKPTVATEIASVAGINCDLDPALTTAMSHHCGMYISIVFHNYQTIY